MTKAMKTLGLTALMALGAVSVAHAQAVSTPSLQGSFLSPEAPVAPKLIIDPALLGPTPKAEDASTSALAQVADSAETQRKVRKVSLYKQLMELNGTSKNVRMIMRNTKSAVKLVILERAGITNLSPAQEAKFNQIADRVLKETEVSIIDQIANAQAVSFSEDEIASLINANSGIAAAKYTNGKLANPEVNAQQIQGYMVDAVIKIIKTFQQSIAS